MSDTDDLARKILGFHTWAVVGCSPDPGRPSHGVARFLRRQGYEVIPINPREDEILGLRCYASLEDVPDDAGIEVVDVFRRSDQAGAHVDEAIAVGARAVWMQLGVIDEAAAERGRAAGLDVVMNRCPAIEHPRLVG